MLLNESYEVLNEINLLKNRR